MGWSCLVLVSLVMSGTSVAAQPSVVTYPGYFEGRWAFLDEDCKASTNWTMISGGNFVSEDLVGTWTWQEGELVLSLNDLAVDEETGEAGGRFRMDGPVNIVDQDRFDFTIAPDVYQMQRCPG